MSLKSLSVKLSTTVGRQVLTVQKHSPALLFGTGAVGMIATAVLASRATLKMHDILELSETDRATAADLAARASMPDYNGAEYTEKDYKKDLSKIKVHTAIQIVKNYAPAIVIGVVTLGCLTGSHVILSRRNAAVTAAYATLDKAYKEYRERVSGEVGKERELELYYGLENKEIAVEDEHGSTTKTVKAVGPEGLRSPYAMKFNKKNPNWRPSNDMNEYFLKNVRKFATDRLQKRGHIFLNEVLDLLGMDHTREGAVVGWVMGHGDGYVTFTRNENQELYLIGDEREVWLDPNVDGVIFDLLDSNFGAKVEAD